MNLTLRLAPLVQVGMGRTLNPMDMEWVPQVPVDMGWVPQVSVDMGWVPQVPVDMGWVPQVPVDMEWVPQVMVLQTQIAADCLYVA